MDTGTTQNCATTAGTAAVLEIKAEGNCISGAFAVNAKEVSRALAQPTVVGSYDGI